MDSTPSFEVSRLIRRLREEAGLTQRELAERVGTTQSVISRLENDDYHGHSLSMLYRIGAALGRRIEVAAEGADVGTLSVREGGPSYGGEAPAHGTLDGELSSRQLDRLAQRLAQRFGAQGVTEADVLEAVRWAGAGAGGRSVTELRGAIEVGPGDVVDDVRQARAQRGRPRDRP